MIEDNLHTYMFLIDRWNTQINNCYWKV